MNDNKETAIEGKHRELALRVASGIPAMTVLLAIIGFAPWQAVAGLVVLSCLVGMVEFQQLSKKIIGQHAMAVSLTGTVLIAGGAYLSGNAGLQAMLAFALLLLLLFLLPREMTDEQRMRRVSLGVFGLIWIPWSFSHLVLLVQKPDGAKLLFFLVLVMTFNDTLAYFIGKYLGRHKLMPKVSPNKTIEGSLGGLAGGALGGYVAVTWVLPPHYGWELPLMIGLSLLMAMVGQVGDLVESMVKRAAGVKDSGRFLPGHGGFLDRLDVFLLAPPFMYYYFWFFF